MSAAQILRQAESLKSAVADTSRGANEAWVSRQTLQDLYQKILVVDLEYALDKKVEQDLWNHAFKNQINTLQSQAKDKQNPKRGEIQSSLNLFLETASGFYLQLLQELCSAFKLDLPFRRKSPNIGILKEYGPVINKVKVPKKSSCMYICQHCLVHMGDIARYRQQAEQAQTYYRHAARLVPYNGQPYNQLAILEAAKGNKLSTVFYYIRSIAVKHPFPVASTNLEKFYNKLSKDAIEHKGKLSMSEIISTFLQFHAFVHLGLELKRAKSHGEKLINSLPTHITSMSFSSYQLVQMVAINLFALDHAKRKLDSDYTENNKDEVKEVLSQEEEQCYDMVFQLTVSVLENLLHHTPKQEAKAKEYHTLPVIKVLFDWLHTDRDLMANEVFKNSSIWPNLSKLLNNLQFHNGQKDISWELEKYSAVPLPEDCDLQCFVPIIKTYRDLDFHLMPCDGLSAELELRLRCHRMIENGLWICEEFPSLNLLNVQKLKSGRLQFSSPTAQVRLLPPGDSGSILEKKSYRQNVAIQAIMQNKARKGKGGEVNTPPEQLEVQIKENLAPITDNQGTSPLTLSDAGVSTHDSGSLRGDLGSLSGGESGSDSTRSDTDTISPSQPRASFPHGMFQMPAGMQNMLSRSEPNKESFESSNSNGGKHGTIGQPKHFAHIQIASQEQMPSNYTHGNMDVDRQKADMHADINKSQKSFVTMSGPGAIGQFDPMSLRREGDGHNPQQARTPPSSHTPPSTVPQHRPPPSHMAMSPPVSNPMSPAYQQLQQLAQQQFLAQQAQQIQARQNQTGGPLGGMSGQRGPIGPEGFSSRLPPQLRSPGGGQGTTGRGGINFPPPSMPSPGKIGPPNMGNSQMRQQPPPNFPRGFPPELLSAFTNPSHPGQDLLQALSKQLPPGGSRESHGPGFPPPRFSLPLNTNPSPSSPGTIGQSFHSHASMVEGDHIPRLTPGAGPANMRNSPFFPVANQYDGRHQQPESPNRGPQPSDSLLPHFSVSPGISVSFNPITEEPPKPDSPPSRQIGGRVSSSDPFVATPEGNHDMQATLAPYMLFSQSPWSVGMVNKAETKSHSSSPFGSSSSSVRTTPDPFSMEDRPAGINISLGYNFGPAPPPPHPHDSSGSSMWTSQSSLSSTSSVDSAPMADPRHQMQANNMQALWSSHHGPSPLEKLLEQQKNQRMGDPH